MALIIIFEILRVTITKIQKRFKGMKNEISLVGMERIQQLNKCFVTDSQPKTVKR